MQFSYPYFQLGFNFWRLGYNRNARGLWIVIKVGRENHKPIIVSNYWFWFRLIIPSEDVRQVPYDFYSIMHYDQYRQVKLNKASADGLFSFVTGSTPSITTKVEYFNKIIGQRRGFSAGDHQKINHLYKCPRPLRNSVTSGFDKFRFFDGFA